MSSELGLSLFRVLQEAIHNCIKHAGVNRVEVCILEDSGLIHLTVRDAGCGFDVASAMQGRGLGLISMRERVRLVGGSITIDSKYGDGTMIHVSVPLGSDQVEQRLAVWETTHRPTESRRRS